ENSCFKHGISNVRCKSNSLSPEALWLDGEYDGLSAKRRTVVQTVKARFLGPGVMIDLTNHRASDGPSLPPSVRGFGLVVLFKGDGLGDGLSGG
ncbi:hypothetical protein HAX54_006480, partial [Datura stramonium]|nr:hypothetical protein [Datura stramonium]